MLIYFTVNTVAELLCFIVAFVCLRNHKDRVWQSLIAFMLITVTAEMLGIHIKKVYHQPNAWVYNILLLIQAFFYLRTFRQLLAGKPNALLINLLALVFLAAYVYEAVAKNFFPKTALAKYDYYNFANSVFAVIVIFLSLFYLYKLLKSDEYVALGRSAEFWWVAGALFFYFGSAAINVFYFKLVPASKEKQYVLTYIYYVLNIVLYSCWSFSFICKRWQSLKR